MLSTKSILIVGSVFGGLAVVLGAFAAHGLKNVLSAPMLAVFETGVRYLSVHAVVLLLCGLFTLHFPNNTALMFAALFFVLGVLLFSGSLFVLAFDGPRWVGPITPVGGLCLILGWLTLAIAFAKLKFAT